MKDAGPSYHAELKARVKALNDPEDIEKYGKNRYKAKALSGTQVGRTLFVQHILLEPELPLAPAAHPDSPE